MICLTSDDVLLFQGDSITHGGRVESDWDFNHVIGHGYQDYLAQTLGLANINRNPTILNRGVSGDTILRITERRQSDILDLHPTILSILVGVNDACTAAGNTDLLPDCYERAYRALLAEVTAQLPGIRLIIGQPFLYPHPLGQDAERRPQAIEYARENAKRAELIARDYDAVFVRYADVFDKYLKHHDAAQLIWDGIHPTYVGHGIMAQRWLETVEKELKR